MIPPTPRAIEALHRLYRLSRAAEAASDAPAPPAAEPLFERITAAPRYRPRAGIRHDDGPIPHEWAARVARERWRVAMVVAIGLLVLALAGGVR